MRGARAGSDQSRPSWGILLSNRLQNLEKAFQKFASGERKLWDADTYHISAHLHEVDVTLQRLITSQSDLVSRNDQDHRTLNKQLSSINSNITGLATSFERLVSRMNQDLPSLPEEATNLNGSHSDRIHKGRSLPANIRLSTTGTRSVRDHVSWDGSDFHENCVPPVSSLLANATESVEHTERAKKRANTVSSPILPPPSSTIELYPLQQSNGCTSFRPSSDIVTSQNSSKLVNLSSTGVGSADREDVNQAQAQVQNPNMPPPYLTDVDVKPKQRTIRRVVSQAYTPLVTSLEEPQTLKPKKSFLIPTRRTSFHNKDFNTPFAPAVGPRTSSRSDVSEGTRITHKPSRSLPEVLIPVQNDKNFPKNLNIAHENASSPRASLKSPTPAAALGLKRKTFSSWTLHSSHQISQSPVPTPPFHGYQRESELEKENRAVVMEEEIKTLKDFASTPNLKIWQEIHNNKGLPDLQELKEHLRIQEEWNYVIDSTAGGQKLKMASYGQGAQESRGADSNMRDTCNNTQEKSRVSIEKPRTFYGNDTNGTTLAGDPATPKKKLRLFPPAADVTVVPPLPVETTIVPTSPHPPPPATSRFSPDEDKPNEAKALGTRHRPEGGKSKGFLPRLSNPFAESNSADKAATAGGKESRSISKRLANSLYSLGTNF